MVVRSFPFENSKTRDYDAIKQAFHAHDMTVECIKRECHGLWTWVLLSDGALWLLDKSHGCGGVFKLEKGP